MHACVNWRSAAVVVLSSLLAVPALAGPGPRFNARAVDLGATSPSRTVPVTVWLQMHDGGLLESTVQAQQDSASPSFQSWSSPAALGAFAPTATEAATVASYLTSRGLTVTGIGPQNLFVRAVGTAAQVQAALKVQLHDFRLNGQTYFSNTAKASLPSHVAPLVAYVGGMTNFGAKPMIARPVVPGASRPAPMALSAAPQGLIFSASCFRPPQSVHFTSADADATYFGNRYGQDIDNEDAGTVAPCGYQPSEIQTAYRLDKLYRAGLDGRGQTVAIVDAFGSTTIRQDVAAFSAFMGLPPADLTILGTPTGSNFDPDPNIAGWAAETTLDVEWVHAIAPKAKIVLVVAADNSFDNLFQGIIDASNFPGVSVISNSWGSIELATTPEFRQAADAVFKSIGARGIAINFSTGDSGDESINLGVADADWPASSPFVSGIGGVSLSLNSKNQIAFQTAWGNNITQIADPTGSPVDPVNNEGFVFGGGGGVSDVYSKPSFQRRLPGSRRMIPDISWLADPFTGVEIIFTADAGGDLAIDVIGGTSLSCPMFSALWAISAQRVGHRLGQAAAYVYNLDDDAITDVKSVGSRFDVSGLIRDAGGNSPEVPSDLAAPLQNLPDFYSALYNSPFSGNWFVLTFGTDSTLPVTDGYDLATGVGTPNPPDFVDAVAKKSR